MANAHLAAVRAAGRTSAGLRRMFGRMGTEEHPRGAVLSAYRNARRAMRDVLRRRSPQMMVEAAEVMGGLREEMNGLTMGYLLEADELGQRQAMRELRAYGVEVGGLRSGIGQPTELAAAHEAWMGTVDQQLRATRMAVLFGEPGLIIGDEERMGILSPGPVVREGARWVAIMAMLGWLLLIRRAEQRWGIEFQRQAVAAIDERTTDCCLRVHGQVVGLKEDFRLTGTPRFADRLRDSPFHWY